MRLFRFFLMAVGLLFPCGLSAHGVEGIAAMQGSRGVIELDWNADHVSRVLTAGYPESFSLSSFFAASRPGWKPIRIAAALPQIS